MSIILLQKELYIENLKIWPIEKIYNRYSLVYKNRNKKKFSIENISLYLEMYLKDQSLIRGYL